MIIGYCWLDLVSYTWFGVTSSTICGKRVTRTHPSVCPVSLFDDNLYDLDSLNLIQINNVIIIADLEVFGEEVEVQVYIFIASYHSGPEYHSFNNFF